MIFGAARPSSQWAAEPRPLGVRNANELDAAELVNWRCGARFEVTAWVGEVKPGCNQRNHAAWRRFGSEHRQPIERFVLRRFYVKYGENIDGTANPTREF